MKYGHYVMTVCALVAFVFCGQYGLDAYTKAGHLKSEEENLMVRKRLLRRQVVELEQKARTMKRVDHFVRRAQEQRLTPEHWSAYDVQIQDLMTFPELAQIIEQCLHNKDIYFHPTSFQVTLDPKKELSPEELKILDPVPILPDAGENQSFDIALALQGTFMVRH